MPAGRRPAIPTGSARRRSSPTSPTSRPRSASARFLSGHLIGNLVSFGGWTGRSCPRLGACAPVRAAAPAGRDARQPDGAAAAARRSPSPSRRGTTCGSHTDQGRLRAASPGLDKLEGELADAGFLRVHRRYVVNLEPRPGDRARAEGRRCSPSRPPTAAGSAISAAHPTRACRVLQPASARVATDDTRPSRRPPAMSRRCGRYHQRRPTGHHDGSSPGGIVRCGERRCSPGHPEKVRPEHGLVGDAVGKGSRPRSKEGRWERPDGSARSSSGHCGAIDAAGCEPDLVAGLAVWAILVPESLAYAVLAGVPPVVGLWAAPAALVLYAALGSSRHLVVGPMSATAVLSGVVVAGLASGDPGRAVALTAGLALVTGLITVAAGLLRLGFLAGFVSQPVLKGFIIGLALTIVAGQLPKLLGARAGGRRVRREGLGAVDRAGAHQRVGGRRRRGFAGAAAASAALRPPGAVGDGRGAGRGAGLGAAGPARAWGGRRRADRERSAAVRAARSSDSRTTPPLSARGGHRPRRVRRGPRLRRRRTRPRRATTSSPTASCSGSGRRTWALACAPGWWWAAACPRPPPTVAQVRARRCPGWSSPC